MPVLECNVVSCIHNSENRCCKGNILVEGSDAKTSEGTFCASFYEREEDSFRNEYETPDYSLQVDCEATHCRFNDNCECNAEHIGIGGGSCSCSEDTRCSSFDCTCGCK